MNRHSRSSMTPGNRRLSGVDLPRNGRRDEGALSKPLTRPARAAAAQANKVTKSRNTSKAQSADNPQSPKAQAQRTRRKWKLMSAESAKAWLGRLSLMTGLIVVVSASIAVAWGLRRYMRTSPRFAVRNVQVDGNSKRTPKQVATRAGVLSGLNIFSVDEAVAKAAIEADPWIATAEVHVDLPNSVRITVTEREARAISVVAGKLFLTDVSGNIFKEVAPTDTQDLPIVTGISSDEVANDREGLTARIRRALVLMNDLEEAKIAKRYPIQELHLDADGSIKVTVGTDGTVLAFGAPPFRAKVDKAVRILEELRYRKVRRAVLFLDNRAHPERVVVRLQSKVKTP